MIDARGDLTNNMDMAAMILAAARARLQTLMQIRAGDRVLDVGCGAASDTMTLANFVGPEGSVAGVDIDPLKIEAAERAAAAFGVSTWVRHQNCDATEPLPFQNFEFNSCCSVRFFECVPEATRVLSEMVRVTRPGGWIAVLDTDWATLSIDMPEASIERRMARAKAESCLCNGYAARQMYRNFRCLELVEIQVELFPIFFTNVAAARRVLGLDRLEKSALAAGLVAENEIDRWRAALHQAERTGTFFASVCLELVAGRRNPNEVFGTHWGTTSLPERERPSSDPDLDG